MTCSPSYTYRPTFVPSPDNFPGANDCTAPSFNEHRSRIFVGGTYFRSIDQSFSENFISVELLPSGGLLVLTIRRYDPTLTTVLETETFSIIPGVPDILDPTICVPDDIENLRQAVGYDGNQISTPNGTTNHSTLIEMLPRGEDTKYDLGGIDIGCLAPFAETFLVGGDGGPTDGAGLATIRTGPERSIIIIRTTEDYAGEDIRPPGSRRIQQWDGTQWISYCNDVQGSCPLEGTC